MVLWQAYLYPPRGPAGEVWADYTPWYCQQIEAWYQRLPNGGPPVLLMDGGYLVTVGVCGFMQVSPRGRSRRIRRVTVDLQPHQRMLAAEMARL